MKKYIVLLAVLMIAICGLRAEGVQKVYDIKYHADPYTCKKEVKLEAKYRYNNVYTPNYVRYYEYNFCGDYQEITEARNKLSYTVTTEYAYQSYIVASGRVQRPINAPSNNTSQADEPDYCLPSPAEFIVEQYDIYNVTVDHPMVGHVVKLQANLITEKAEYQLFSTNGGYDEEGKPYCGYYNDTYLMYDKSRTKILETSTESPIPGNGKLSLSPTGTGQYHEYYVYAANHHMNAPAHRDAYTPDPDNSSYRFVWGDHFLIQVDYADCESGYVYRKWNDFLFVDNGMNGGDGQFVEYQWMNQDGPIPGATKQWYRSSIYEDGKAPSGKYYVIIKLANGNEITTCPMRWSEFPQSTYYNNHGYIGAPAHKELQNGQLIIELDGVKYNAQGMKIQ